MHDDINQLIHDYNEAKGDYSMAKEKENYARVKTIAALTRLNGIQKKINAYIEEVRKGAPDETDWGRESK